MELRGWCLAVTLSSILGVLPGCGLLDPRPTGSVEPFSTASLTAVLQLPRGYDRTRPYPLVVALHGYGGSADGFVSAFSSLEGDSLLVVVPQGEYPTSFGGYSWFYLTKDRSLWEEYDSRSVRHVMELVAAVGDRHPVGRVFVLGFSQGASLAYMTGLLNPSSVSGILAIGGHLPEIDTEGSIVHARNVEDARGVKIFVAHGTGDVTVGRNEYVVQRDFLLASGYSVTAYEYAGGHYFTDDLLARVRSWLRETSRE